MAEWKGVGLLLFAIVMFSTFGSTIMAQPYASTSWLDAHATFYGGYDASGTMGGACGYSDLFAQGYGTDTAALSDPMFNNGLSCGACFQLVCKVDETSWCYPGKSITVTATNRCPFGSAGGWCDSPKLHFDLAYPAFTQLAQEVGGVIPVSFMRVPCSKQGGTRFTVNGNPWYADVLVHNVGGAGDVQSISIKGDYTDAIPMTHVWGQVWRQDWPGPLLVQSLSFRVTAGDANYQQTCDFWDVSGGPTWFFGQTFESPNNFVW